MRLLRLLSAGKSFVGGVDNQSRYQMGRPGMLPKFGTGKNPFLSKGSPPELRQELKRKPEAARKVESANSPVLGSLKHKEPPQKASIRERWTSSLKAVANPIASLKHRISTRKSTRRAQTGSNSGAQAELCLDKIKVMRNDLTDADMEVFARRPKPAGSAIEKSEAITHPGRAAQKPVARRSPVGAAADGPLLIPSAA